MALIQCPECGRQISDKAAACPNCGAPVSTSSDDQIRTPTQQPATATAAEKPSDTGQVLGIVGVALGAASLLMPYFAAVFLVPAAFVCGLISLIRSKRPRVVWIGLIAMALAVGGLVWIIHVSQEIQKVVDDPFAPSSLLGTDSPPVVTLAEYNQLRVGMSYAEATRIIGESGEELSRTDMAGYSTVMYSWTNPSGSNMIAMFQNGKLETKSQFGLR